MQPHRGRSGRPALPGDPRSARHGRCDPHHRAPARAAPHAGESPSRPRQGPWPEPPADRVPDRRAGASTRRPDLRAQARHAHGDVTPRGHFRPGGERRALRGQSRPRPFAAAFVPTPRPIVQATAPERYRVQFTIGQETHEKLRRLQGLLRREIPDGDPGAIFDRALTLLLERVEKKKLGATARPRPRAPIRPGTDSSIRKPAFRSREVPREVKRAVWRRDDGQCGYICPGGRRCSERTFLEFHHVQPHAKQGPATVANISLRCWRHNQYEAELIFGPRRDRSCGGAPALRP
jgi:5-methylcytosine-specific restriction endonuclease McrA